MSLAQACILLALLLGVGHGRDCGDGGGWQAETRSRASWVLLASITVGAVWLAWIGWRVGLFEAGVYR